MVYIKFSGHILKICLLNQNGLITAAEAGGGLIDFAISSGINAYGYEEDYANKICTDRNLPIIKADQINEYEACFYFITLIEVIEHIENPI